MKKFLLVVSVLLIVLVGFVFLKRQKAITQKPVPSFADQIFSGLGYSAVDPTHFAISLFADQVPAPTRIKITPDGKHLLVTEITGQVIAFDRIGGEWSKTSYPLLNIDTHFPGLPPEEGGLTGVVFSSDFEKNGKLFLLHSFKDQDGKIFNRVSLSTVSSQENRLVATPPQQIFEANTIGSDSHQITDGIALKVGGVPQLLFAVGEGFNQNTAQNPSAESGKILMISEDGSNPVGERPFAQNPKIQAIGLRNAYVLTQNPYQSANQNLQNVMIADTGPNRFDRIIYPRLFSLSGNKIQPINLGWNGDEDNLQKPIPDPNHVGIKDMVLLRLPETRTFTGLAFHPGKGAIPKSTTEAQSILMTLYGKTGSTQNTPGKEIWLGRLSGSTTAPTLSTKPIIIRNPEAAGKMGNPIGLEIDPQTGNFFFADVVEGRIYQVSVK